MKPYEEVIAFHGHSCGGLALGYKVAELAEKLLNLSFSEDEEVVCIAETDSCTVDAIQVVTGCTLGKGNLIINKWGKNAFSFYNRKTGESIRLVGDPEAMPTNSEMVKLRPEVFSGKVSPDDVERFHELSRKYVDDVLSVQAEKLFIVKETEENVPDKAKVYNNLVCSICGEPVEEGFCIKFDEKYICISCMRKSAFID